MAAKIAVNRISGWLRYNCRIWESEHGPQESADEH
jgi:hypothetical protein